MPHRHIATTTLRHLIAVAIMATYRAKNPNRMKILDPAKGATNECENLPKMHLCHP